MKLKTWEVVRQREIMQTLADSQTFELPLGKSLIFFCVCLCKQEINKIKLNV